MNEWLKKVTAKIKELWSKWKPLQKVIFFAIIAAIIVLIVVTVRTSAKPSTTRVFSQAVTDQDQLARIVDRIDQENIKVYVNEGYISVDDEKTARRLRTLLVSENLVPSNVRPFSNSFYKRDWSTTDADQLVKLNKELQNELKEMIKSLDGIRDANVIIVRPEDKLFAADQKPVTAAVKIYPMAGSDFVSNRKKVQGLQRLILAAVEGLTDDNIVITDESGNQINDFDGLAESDRIANIEKTQKLIHKLEIQYTGEILDTLQNVYTDDRIRNLNVKIDMDMSQKESQSTIYTPFERKKDNPDTPYDDSEIQDSVVISVQEGSETWEGTGYNPEGPAGTEGQNPPVYSDMSNVVGRQTKTVVTKNNVVNTTNTQEVVAPKIDKFSVSVNVDGTWKTKKDPKTGKVQIDEYGAFVRDYIPPTEKELTQVRDYIRGAIGYDRNRGDVVNVTSIQIDRSAQFAAEEAAYWAAIQRRRTILLVLVVIAVVLIGFILFRIISKEIERRRREREARLLAEQQAARERALWEAKEDGMEVTMSVEETRRMELQENAVTMAKEHPEDVAMLIRTWLMEE